MQETLRAKSVVTNRAPILTAWATVVAERLGFKRAEALSIAHVFVGVNASAAKGAKQPELGENQPFVELMGRKVSHAVAIVPYHVATGADAFAPAC